MNDLVGVLGTRVCYFLEGCRCLRVSDALLSCSRLKQFNYPPPLGSGFGGKDRKSVYAMIGVV